MTYGMMRRVSGEFIVNAMNLLKILEMDCVWNAYGLRHDVGPDFGALTQRALRAGADGRAGRPSAVQ